MVFEVLLLASLSSFAIVSDRVSFVDSNPKNDGSFDCDAAERNPLFS